jgi:hypothetical protein
MDTDYCLSAWCVANFRGTWPKVCKGFCLFIHQFVRTYSESKILGVRGYDYVDPRGGSDRFKAL